jgi:hypothetical protein
VAATEADLGASGTSMLEDKPSQADLLYDTEARAALDSPASEEEDGWDISVPLEFARGERQL